MSIHLGLTVARMHGVLAGRRRSAVYHVYVGPTTPTGRSPRGVRPVCSARTRPLTILRRCGVTVDVHGRRMCANCSARLTAMARRAEQPPSNVDQRKAFFEATGVTSSDLVVALAVASSVEETHAIANVTNLLFGPASFRRPKAAGKAQARYDFEAELLRRRRSLATAELTPEERDAIEAKREAEAMRDEQIRAQRTKDDQMNRALDRRIRSAYLMPHERELLNSA